MAKNALIRGIQAVVRVFQPPAEKFYELLGQSGSNVKRGAEMLHDLLANYESVGEEGDRVTQEILRRLDREFITPMDREDISQLAQCLDDVLDLCEGVAMRVGWFRFAKPTPVAVALSEILLRCAGEIEHCVGGLKHIGGDHSHHWRSIHSLENQADEMERGALAAELDLAKEHIESGEWRDFARAMVHASQWREIYERLERATDRCEDAANVLETLSAKYG